MHWAINIQNEPSPEICDYLGNQPAPGQPTAISDEAKVILSDESGQILVNE